MYPKATVAEVDPDSAAAKSGLRPGDVLLNVAGKAIADANDLRRVLAIQRAGSVVELVLSRGGHKIDTKATLTGPAPAEEGVREGKGWDFTKGGGKPQHMSAWCKERLGWITPTTIDPSVPQKLILAPIYKSPKECYKVLARPDGSEYFLLENRGGSGFDASLPASGMLIWRVTRGRPLLEEAHGVAGPMGPRSYPEMVPYPSKANDAFTPNTVPSSRAQLGGGTEVHITNIRRLPDGRVTFMIGYEFY